MAQIALIVGDPGPFRTAVVNAVRDASSAPIVEILNTLGSGEPVFEKKLFDRSDEAFPARLLALLEELERLGVHYAAYEVLNGRFDPNRAASYWTLTAARLRNLINEHQLTHAESQEPMHDATAVARRALALATMTLRSQAENGIIHHREQAGGWTRYASDLLTWSRAQGIESWLSPSEQVLQSRPIGGWTPQETFRLFWRLESMKALLWAISIYPTMPWYHEVGDARAALAPIPVGAPVHPFLAQARLRSVEELEVGVSRALFLNWRCRTESLRIRGMHPPMGDSYEAVVARALSAVAEEGIQVQHDGFDILVFGVRFSQLDGQRKADMMSLCYERHLALDWIVSGVPWDEARADT